MTDSSVLAAELPSFYRYGVGDIEVTAIHDGINRRPLEGLVRNAGLEEVRKALEDRFLPTDSLPITFTALVLRSGGRTVLIDTGNGDSGAKTAGRFMAGFRGAGFDPKSVDTVIISHFHGDHINGLRLRDGTWVYENAEILVPAPEWDFWMDDGRAGQASPALKPIFENSRRVFGPVANEVRQYQAEEDLAPGIRAIAAPGHTPGHMAFALSSGNESVMAVSDITNHPALFVRNPDWAGAFDIDPEEARRTRRRILDQAVHEGMRLAFYHAPFPAVGRIARAGSGYEFVPVQWGVD